VPLGKKDNPANYTPMVAPKATEADGSPKKVTGPDDKATHAAINDAIDSGAGAPPELREAAEDLPEKDDVQKAIKAAMLADDAQTEAKEKAKVVDLSPDSDETPSGIALKAVTGIADDVERGEEYSRIKSAVRHGYVPADDASLKAKK
jgi:hypothetical protein